MPKHEPVSLDGVITDIFAHRFVLETEAGRFLADLGPKGAERFALTRFAHVSVKGERTPSEIKVRRIGLAGQKPVDVDEKKPKHADDKKRAGDKKHDDDAPADAQAARDAIASEGYTVVAEPRQKRKHFEFLVRREGTAALELHVRFDGTITKTKDLPKDGGKWGDAAGARG